MKTRKGKLVRADFNVVLRDDAEHSLTWAQRVEGTPFARLLSVGGDGGAPGGGTAQATKVTIELRQVLNGMFPRFGGFMVRRAARATLDEALDGLERIGG